jgi:glucose-6-phosphate isomerase
MKPNETLPKPSPSTPDVHTPRVDALPSVDGDRVTKYTFTLGDLSFDFSKNHINETLIESYIEKATALGFESKRRQLFEGYPINVTENRSVLHTLLRGDKSDDIDLHNKDDEVSAKKSQSTFLAKIDEIRKEHIEGKQPIENIIHIGIGGSSLGPQLVYESLAGNGHAIKVHFVDNIDAHQILYVLSQCKPESTLVFGVSKTFTTQETLVNIETVKKWYEDNGSVDFYKRFYAVTANIKNVDAESIHPSKVVTFPNWVGGRYSVWSSVSLSVALVLGREQFIDFLDGAALVDQDFRALPLVENPIFLAAAMDHYYANKIGAASRAIFAYDFRLRSLVPYLQQLEMESNGKDRDVFGNLVAEKTSPIIWGGTGTSMQHSTFQLLHQGTHCVPVEFILVKTPAHKLVNHHRKLIANGLAQSAALLVGQSLEEVSNQLDNKALTDEVKKSKIFSGQKPSTTILLSKLTACSLGQLLAFYEHRVFCNGVLSNINSFDQMGVELGKQLANSIEPFLTPGKSPQEPSLILDASTARLITKILST